METRFENRYIRQKSDILEFYYGVTLKKQTRASVVLIIVCVVSCVFAAVLNRYDILLLLCVCVAGGVLIYFSPHLLARNVEESTLRLHNGQRHEMVVRFADRIETSEGTTSMALEYSQIVGLHALTHVTALMIDKHNALLIRNDGFTMGSYEEFLVFIRRACGHLHAVK